MNHPNYTSEIHAVMMGALSAPRFPATVEPPLDSPDWEPVPTQIANYGVTPANRITA
jgi:hypothetical protein